MRKKITSLLLSAAMLLSYAMPVMAEVTDDMAASPEIGLGDSLVLEVSTGGETAYCKFIPAVSGNYVFYSTGGYDTYVTLFSDEGNSMAYDDDNGDGSNFRLEYELEAGKTYYFGVRYYSTGLTGEINVTLDHNHAWSDFSTNNDGTHTKTCSICNAKETTGCTYEDTAEGTEIIHTCTKCGYSYREAADPDCSNHQLVKVPAAEPTCTDNGHAEYYHCETCGKMYTDALSKNLCTMDDLLIPPLGHDWGASVSNNDGTHTRTCTRCDAQEAFSCRYKSQTAGKQTKFTCTECGYSYTIDSGKEQTITSWDFEDGTEGWNYYDVDGDGKCYYRSSYTW